jgi:hypothetical protein
LAALANNVIINDKPVVVYKAIFEMVDGLLMILSSHPPPICTAKHFEVCSFEVRLRSAQSDSFTSFIISYNCKELSFQNKHD